MAEIESRKEILQYCPYCTKLLGATKTTYVERNGRKKYIIEIICNTCGKQISRKEY
jgi:RNase P subunit RPR2